MLLSKFVYLFNKLKRYIVRKAACESHGGPRPMNIRESLAAVMAVLAAVVSSANHRLDFALDFAEAWFESTNPLSDRAREAGMGARVVRASQISDNILTYVVVGLVIIIGILVYSEVEVSMPDPTNNALSDASSNATDTFASAMELAPLVILVGVAGLILFVIRRF